MFQFLPSFPSQFTDKSHHYLYTFSLCHSKLFLANLVLLWAFKRIHFLINLVIHCISQLSTIFPYYSCSFKSHVLSSHSHASLLHPWPFADRMYLILEYLLRTSPSWHEVLLHISFLHLVFSLVVTQMPSCYALMISITAAAFAWSNHLSDSFSCWEFDCWILLSSISSYQLYFWDHPDPTELLKSPLNS